MGTGMAARHVDIITEELIGKYAGKELHAFKVGFRDVEYGVDGFAQGVVFENIEKGDEHDNRYEALQKAFLSATGLELLLGYYDSDYRNGSGEELVGAYWRVEGVYQLTPAGAKFIEFVQREYLVHIA
jgi:hypothetical protein